MEFAGRIAPAARQHIRTFVHCELEFGCVMAVRNRRTSDERREFFESVSMLLIFCSFFGKFNLLNASLGTYFNFSVPLLLSLVVSVGRTNCQRAVPFVRNSLTHTLAPCIDPSRCLHWKNIRSFKLAVNSIGLLVMPQSPRCLTFFLLCFGRISSAVRFDTHLFRWLLLFSLVASLCWSAGDLTNIRSTVSA